MKITSPAVIQVDAGRSTCMYLLLVSTTWCINQGDAPILWWVVFPVANCKVNTVCSRGCTDCNGFVVRQDENVVCLSTLVVIWLFRISDYLKHVSTNFLVDVFYFVVSIKECSGVHNFLDLTVGRWSITQLGHDHQTITTVHLVDWIEWSDGYFR
jgi:hypothetical protein